jgi:ribosomal protein L37E
MKCARCGQEFNHPDTDICGNCADDLRAEAEAEAWATQAADEEMARQRHEQEELEKSAYEQGYRI